MRKVVEVSADGTSKLAYQASDKRLSLIEKISHNIDIVRDAQRLRPGSEIEVEARLGFFTTKGYNPNLPRAQWMMAKDALYLTSLPRKEKLIQSEDYKASRYR